MTECTKSKPLAGCPIWDVAKNLPVLPVNTGTGKLFSVCTAHVYQSHKHSTFDEKRFRMLCCSCQCYSMRQTYPNDKWTEINRIPSRCQSKSLSLLHNDTLALECIISCCIVLLVAILSRRLSRPYLGNHQREGQCSRSVMTTGL